MTSRKKASWLVALLALTVGAASATPIGPSQLVVFGDSLSDGGNAAAAILSVSGSLQTIPFPPDSVSFVPSAPYLLSGNPLDARFSNGPVWVERLAHALGLPLNAALVGGTNFAFGGADSGPLPGVPMDPIPTLTTQVQLYLGGLQAAGADLDQNALFVVFGGGNDLRALTGVTASASEAAFIASLQMTGDFGAAVAAADQAAMAAFAEIRTAGGSIEEATAAAEAAGQGAFVAMLVATGGDVPAAQAAGAGAAAQAAQQLIFASVNNLLGVVDTLIQAGALNLLVPLVPDVSLTPESQNLPAGTRALVSQLSLGLNQILLEGLATFMANPALSINILDTVSLFADITDQPSAFGISNTTDACITTAICADPNQYLFWDGIHPTSTVHQILADEALRLVRVPEPGSLVLMGMGLLLIGWSLRRRLRD